MNTQAEQFRCFIKGDRYGAKDQQSTVSGWLKRLGNKKGDNFNALWTETLTFLSGVFQRLEAEKVNACSLRVLHNVVFSELYIIDYGRNDMVTQFREKTAKLKDFLAKVEAEAVKYNGLMRSDA